MNKKQGYFSFFILGIILGAMVALLSFSILISYRMDQSYKKVKTLETLLEDQNVRLIKLQEAMHNRRWTVQEIQVEIACEDDLTKISLEKHIKEKLNPLLGKEVKTIDIEMIWQVLDNRIMKMDQKEYQLKVSKLMVYETIKVWIELQEKK